MQRGMQLRRRLLLRWLLRGLRNVGCMVGDWRTCLLCVRCVFGCALATRRLTMLDRRQGRGEGSGGDYGGSDGDLGDGNMNDGGGGGSRGG